MQRAFRPTLLCLALVLLTVFRSTATAQNSWSIDLAHTHIGFAIDHLIISETVGRFTKLEGIILASKPDFTDAVVEIKIPIASIDTDNAKRDKHLQAEGYFDAVKYPHMIFKLTSIAKVKDDEYTVKGNLTIKNVTKPVTLTGRFIPARKDPSGKMRAGFANLQGKINRQDFGVSGGGFAIGDEVRLKINIELVQ
jgi:polyisoprenoid-binding protein YceI